MMEVNIERFRELLTAICDRETSQDPEGWTPDNPLWGHCAIVSVIAQNLFGGELLRASLENTPFAKGRSHYWNKLPDGQEEDFTKSQFGDSYPLNLKAEVRPRSYVLSYPETVKRYKLLAFRLIRALYTPNEIHDKTPLFYDPIYQKCFDNALDSPCQKMKFGGVIIHGSEIVYQGCNKFIEPLKSLCEPTCIRFSIASRTEQMLGACGHAEEFALWEVARMKISLEECDLYIAGFYPNGLPWLKTRGEHTCLRCSIQMYMAKVKTIYVPVHELKDQKTGELAEYPEYIDWEGITAEEALKTAIAYATKEKTV